jgi:hypothetical protein
MKRADVVRLAKAKFGKKAVVEEWKHALDPATRAIVRQELERLKAAEPKPPAEVIEYNRRHAEWAKVMREVRGKLLGGKRYRVLEDLGLGCRIHGQGDTWEEAARQAKLLPPDSGESVT